MIAVALASFLLLASAAGSATPGAPPLTNEDIVRMVAGGTPEREIVDAIRDRPSSFDLSGDMIEELRAAGVPPSILDEMRRKNVDATVASRPPEMDRPGYGTLAVTLKRGGVRLPLWADEDAKARFKLPKETDQREIKDVAVFLACSSPDHVPDLWRSKSPLGRDMVSVRPHQMLAFVAGDTPPGKPPRITLPAKLEARADLTEPHDLVLGVAARIGDRWVQLGVGLLPKATFGPEAKPIVGSIDGGGRNLNVKVELAAAP